MGATRTTLIPIQEMTPGQVGKIRNDVINYVVSIAARELKKGIDDLIVRDVRPFSDLQMYSAGTTAATINEWLYDPTATTADAYTSVTGAKTMGDNKFVALFGIRDRRRGIGVHTSDMTVYDSTGAVPVAVVGPLPLASPSVSLVKVNVGGSDKVIWDTTSLEAYDDALVGFTEAPVIIPQNTAFNIYYYFVSTLANLRAWLQLIGVVVEPRGLTISP